ncbi:MAG: hypothetical protein QOH93_3382 [Chloroflexia bacterium]|jgi:hypothetical protein|nr:hypothetical protein [Chloroflexia bacterium]
MRQPSVKVLIAGTVIFLFLGIVLATATFFPSREQAPASSSLLTVPAQSEPVPNAVATTEAQEQAHSQYVEDVRTGKVPSPLPKDPQYIPTSIPMSIATVEAMTMPTPPGGIGIVQSPSSGWHHRYHIENMWSGAVDGTRVSLYAGSKADDFDVWNEPEQGVLICGMMSDKPEAEYLAPSRHGRLHLVVANGNCLSAVSADGTDYSFDVAQRTWGCGVTKP